MYTVLPRILCVDDEPHVLEGMARHLRRHFDVTLATGGEEGLDRIERNGPFAVVVSDQRMPAMDGVSFLSYVKETAPDTVRILLTGYADSTAAMAAVNRGAVFRFLSKPIEPAELHHMLNEAVAHHRVTTSERVLLQRTLHGSIKAIIDVLALVNPEAFGRAVRAKETISQLAAAISAEDAWQVEIAAMISQVGSVAQSHGSTSSSAPAASLSQMESAAVGRLSRIAADMVANIPRMEEVHAMLVHQDLHFDGSNGGAGSPRERAIPLGARMLRVAFDLDALEQEGMHRAAALDSMRARRGCYDPHLLDALMAPVPAAAPTVPQPTAVGSRVPDDREVEVRRLEPGMVLLEDVRSRTGRVLIGRDETVTAESLRRVKSTLDFNEQRNVVRVRQASSEGSRAGAAGIPIDLSGATAPSSTHPPAVDAGGMMLDLTMKLTV